MYVKKRLPGTFASFIFLFLEYFVCSKVYLMGDDYMYATFAKEGILKSVGGYYFTGNGRWLLNIFDSLLLSVDRYLFIIITPLLLLLFAWLIYNVGVLITAKKSESAFIISLISVATIDIMMARETIYWITGMVNYLLPAVLFLAAVNASLYLVKNQDCSITKKILCGMVCIISSASMEQFALMTVGWIFLLFGYEIVKNKKSKKAVLLLVFSVSVVALASIILAPGNFVRVDNATTSPQTFKDKIFDLFFSNFQSVTATKVVIPLSLAEAIVLFKKSKKKIAVVASLNTLAMLVAIVILNIESILMSAVFFLLFVITSFFTIIALKDHLKPIYSIILIILAVGSQIMLLISDIWGFRISFTVITVYIVFTVLLSLAIDDNKLVLLSVISVYAFYANVYFGIVSAIITLIVLLAKFEKCGKVFKYVVSAVVISWTLINMGLGFSQNVEVHKYNAQEAKAVTETTESVIMKPYNDEIYGWTTPPLSEFHSEYFKRYYGIPENVELICVKNN